MSATLASDSQLAAARPVALLEVLGACRHRDDRPPDRELDVLVPRGARPCGGRRSVVAFVADATHARSLLVALGLPAAPAAFAAACDPTQTELAWAAPA